MSDKQRLTSDFGEDWHLVTDSQDVLYYAASEGVHPDWYNDITGAMVLFDEAGCSSLPELMRIGLRP